MAMYQQWHYNLAPFYSPHFMGEEWSCKKRFLLSRVGAGARMEDKQFSTGARAPVVPT